MNATRFAFVVALVLAAFLNAPGPAAAFCVIVEPPSPLPTQVNGTQVEIQLTEGFARVVIIKEFSNPSDEFKQGQIAFPLEKGHELITDLRLKIGNVVYNSSTQNRSDALGDFLDAIAKGQDAALVQYDPPRDLYWIAVTIPPKEARTTITTLEMPLTKTDGFYEYGYRLSIDARDSVSYLRVHVRVETAAPLGEVLLPGHPDIPVVWSGSALVVLVDTSGSMGLLDRWALAKDAVRRIAGDAHAGESFGVAVFQGAAVTPFSPSLQAWSPAVDGELARFLDSFRPHGSTGLTAALAQASLWALEARRLGQQPVLILVSDGRPTRSPLDPELETAYARISYDQGMPVFAMAVAPADHADETVLHNLSHYHGGELVTLDGDVPAAVADLVASMRVPILEGLRTEIPAAANLTFASANPQTVWQGGEALAIARMRGTAEDSLDLTLTWPAASGGTPALDVRTAGADIPAQPLLKREWALTRIHALLEAARAREDPAVVAELTALATETRVATPYTSLLVLLPQTEQAADRSVSDGSLAGAPLFGPGAGLASPASSGQGFSPVFVPPLVAEARTADALNRDLANPLIAQGEIDRYVDVGSAEYQRLDTPAATSRYEGTYFRVLEVGGELVAVRLGSPEAAQLAANGVGFAGMILAVLALVRLPRRGPRSRNDAADVRTKPELRREVNAPGDGRGLRASGRTSSHIARANSRRRLGRTKPIEERVTSSLAQTAVGYSRARRYCRQWYPRRAFWPWTAIPPSGPIEIVNESGGIFHPRPTALT